MPEEDDETVRLRISGPTEGGRFISRGESGLTVEGVSVGDRTVGRAWIV